MAGRASGRAPDDTRRSLRAADDDRARAPGDTASLARERGSGDETPYAWKGSGAPKGGIRATDGKRAGDLLFTADAPNRTSVMDFTDVRTWAGFVYTAFILDVFAQQILAWMWRPPKPSSWSTGRCGQRCRSATAKVVPSCAVS